MSIIIIIIVRYFYQYDDENDDLIFINSDNSKERIPQVFSVHVGLQYLGES